MLRSLSPFQSKSTKYQWHGRLIPRITHEDRRPSLDRAEGKVPIVRLRVVVEIGPDFCPSVHSDTRHEVQPHLISEHVADRVEVSFVETVHIRGQQRAMLG